MRAVSFEKDHPPRSVEELTRRRGIAVEQTQNLASRLIGIRVDVREN